VWSVENCLSLHRKGDTTEPMAGPRLSKIVELREREERVERRLLRRKGEVTMTSVPKRGEKGISGFLDLPARRGKEGGQTYGLFQGDAIGPGWPIHRTFTYNTECLKRKRRRPA